MYKENRKVTAFFCLPWMYWICSFSSMVLLEKLLFCHEQCTNYSNWRGRIQEQSEWWQPAHNLVIPISLPSLPEAATTFNILELSWNFSRCLFWKVSISIFLSWKKKRKMKEGIILVREIIANCKYSTVLSRKWSATVEKN